MKRRPNPKVDGQQLGIFDLAEGRKRKTRGIERVEASHHGFVRTLRVAAIAHAQEHGTVTADDVRAIAARLGLKPRNKNAWGPVFSGKGWKRMGEAPSVLKTNHAHRNAIWAWEG